MGAPLIWLAAGGATMFALMIAFVVGGNLLLGRWMSRVHEALRQDLAGERVLYEEPSVSMTVSAWAWNNWSRRWVTADVLVTETSAMLFQRNRFIEQPPIQLVREPSAKSPRAQVAGIVVREPARMEDGRVIVEGLGTRTGKWKLSIASAQADALVAALNRALAM